jgi:hypothetical protein
MLKRTPPRIREDQEDKIYEAYWLLKNTDEAASYASVSKSTVAGYWKEYSFKAYYRNKPLPIGIFLNTVSEYYNSSSCKTNLNESKKASKTVRNRISERMNLMILLAEFKKSEKTSDKKE